MTYLRKRFFLLPSDCPRPGQRRDSPLSRNQRLPVRAATVCACLVCCPAVIVSLTSLFRSMSWSASSVVASAFASVWTMGWSSMVDLEPVKHVPLLERNPLEPMRDSELIDVVYVYANKTSSKVVEEYHKLSVSLQNSTKQGFLRSPPSASGEKTIDLDPMETSVRLTATMAQNLGTIYILVNFAEEISEDIRKIRNVQVVLNSQFHNGTYFSSFASESNMHRIPGLSRHFLAMNDDMLFTKPIDLKEFYFTSEGHPRMMYGVDRRIESLHHYFKRRRRTTLGGAKRPLKYTADRLSTFVNAPGLGKLYPIHTPRPYHREYIEFVEKMDPGMFRSPYSTHFRCQDCLLTHTVAMLHSLEAGTLRDGSKYSILAYIDSHSAWKNVLEQWDSKVTVTVQEVDPPVHEAVLRDLDSKVSELLQTK